jgi:hypothetical protein
LINKILFWVVLSLSQFDYLEDFLMKIRDLKYAWIDAEMDDMPELLQKVMKNLKKLLASSKTKQEQDDIVLCIANIENMMRCTIEVSEHMSGFLYWGENINPDPKELANIKKLLETLAFVVTKFPMSVEALLKKLDVRNESREPETLYQKFILGTCQLIDALDSFYHGMVFMAQVCIGEHEHTGDGHSEPKLGFFHREKKRLMQRALSRGEGLEQLQAILKAVQSAQGELEVLFREAEVEFNVSDKRTLK